MYYQCKEFQILTCFINPNWIWSVVCKHDFVLQGNWFSIDIHLGISAMREIKSKNNIPFPPPQRTGHALVFTY